VHAATKSMVGASTASYDMPTLPKAELKLKQRRNVSR
jgi:hypothetical protein